MDGDSAAPVESRATSIQGRRRNRKSSYAASMSSAILTSPPIATAGLAVDTDVASFIFKWHPEFAPLYVDIVRGSELIVSFMTLAEMRQGALDANWGPRRCAVLEAYLADFF